MRRVGPGSEPSLASQCGANRSRGVQKQSNQRERPFRFLEILSTPLLGIIPESKEVLRASNIGSPVTLCNATSAPARAYLSAARRLNGDIVPMNIPTEHQRLFGRLFGRRA